MGVAGAAKPQRFLLGKNRTITGQCLLPITPNYVPAPRSGRKRGAGRGKGAFKAPESSSGSLRLPAALFINPNKNLIPDKNPAIAAAGETLTSCSSRCHGGSPLLPLPPPPSPRRSPGSLLSPNYAGTINIARGSRQDARWVR